MSLLQFKPAPMYILDEIDAALDLSHTQHIGQLFRTRFKGSQFIVVSLKEGLFTNANVLFRTRFRDGTSIVERTANRSTSTLYTQNREQEDENDGGFLFFFFFLGSDRVPEIQNRVSSRKIGRPANGGRNICL